VPAAGWSLLRLQQLDARGGPAVTETVSLYQLFGYNLLVVGSVLALRVLVLIFRPDR
jgi:ubiquinone biosynthesis protein